MEAHDRTIGRGTQNAVANCFGRQFPIESDDGPHHAAQTELRLHVTVAEPADAERGAHEGWRGSQSLLERQLGARKIVVDERWRAETAQRMGVAMIADFVSRCLDLASDRGEPADVGAALEKSRGRAVLPQRIEQQGRAFTGSIVEGNGDCVVARIAPPDRRAENLGRPPTHTVGQHTGAGREDGGNNHSQMIANLRIDILSDTIDHGIRSGYAGETLGAGDINEVLPTLP